MDLASIVTLDPAHRAVLAKIQEAIDGATLQRFDPGLPLTLYVFQGQTLFTALLTQEGRPVHWVHLSVGGAPRVYAPTDQLADCIIKGRDLSMRIFGQEPHSLIVPYRLNDFVWLQRNHSRLALALEGFLGNADCHYGPHRWMSSFQQLNWRPPKLFLSAPDPKAPTIFTDGGKLGASMVIFPPKKTEPSHTLSQEIQGSAQFKELFTVALALQTVPDTFNLFSDSLYVINLLPNLPGSHIKLDANPITPLMIQVRGLLLQRTSPLYIQHLRGHQTIPSLLSKGNALADQLASSVT